MMAAFAALRTWRPTLREQRLLWLLAGVAIAAWALSGFSAMQSANAAHSEATDRLSQGRQQFARLSDSRVLAASKQQSGQLNALTMQDPTVQLSEMRMREELTELAARARLSNVLIEDAPSGADEAEVSAKTPDFVVLVMTLEADFEWSAFVRLLGELEQFYRGYLIDGAMAKSGGCAWRCGFCIRTGRPDGDPGNDGCRPDLCELLCRCRRLWRWLVFCG